MATDLACAYAHRLTGDSAIPWWDAVIVTASSSRQAARYTEEIRRRQAQGRIPPGVHFQVVSDPENERIGTLGATLHALQCLPAGFLSSHFRLLIVHAGGDSRRLPQYSLTGKLFSALPPATTVFDQLLAASTSWAACLSAGMVVASGDVLLSFDSAALRWDRPGISGVAILQPAELASEHGVYIAGDEGQVYSYLQKPSVAEVEAAGGLLPDNRVALDTGLLRFDPEVTRSLSRLDLSGDIYTDVIRSLTNQRPALHENLKTPPFHADVVEGDFTHISNTPAFRRRLTQAATPIVDSVFTIPPDLAPGAVAIECDLDVPVRAQRGAILHGLTGITVPVVAPEDTVVHQVPVILPSGERGYVIRVYGAEDDPKSNPPTWFGLPMQDVLSTLGLVVENSTLWSTPLFPVFETPTEAWLHAQWLTGGAVPVSLAEPRLSLATSAEYADHEALSAQQAKRSHHTWKQTALSLATTGSDIRPLLVHSPGPTVQSQVASELTKRAAGLSDSCESASLHYKASQFYAAAGLTEEADKSKAKAFLAIQSAVSAVARTTTAADEPAAGLSSRVTVSAPPRIDLGGGWSDTPPFCFDWGGTVLNIALELNGDYPIKAHATRLADRVIRLRSESGQAEYGDAGELEKLGIAPGDPLAIHKAALKFFPAPSTGGIEIKTEVDLPMGSGLGTSSILAAAVLKALSELSGKPLDNQQLSDAVMQLEQLMTTGGGWQDQIGGIYPGIKLTTSGPGLKQRLRVEPIPLTPDRQREFESRVVLYYTGIRRIAKNLLAQVVGSYLAREVQTVQVLHSIKTLAVEMAYALKEGDWDYLGSLLNRHWELNKILDPNTTNGPIESLLSEVRPYIAGAKLAGAGGGGFLIMLAKSPRAALALRQKLNHGVYPFRLAPTGLRLST